MYGFYDLTAFNKFNEWNSLNSGIKYLVLLITDFILASSRSEQKELNKKHEVEVRIC